MVNDLVDSPLRVRYVFEGGPWVVFEDPWLLLLLLEYFLFLPSGGWMILDYQGREESGLHRRQCYGMWLCYGNGDHRLNTLWCLV